MFAHFNETQSLVIDHLLHHPGKTSDELFKSLNHGLSLNSFYRHVADLLKRQILVKIHLKLFISHKWMHEVETFVSNDKYKSQYFIPEAVVDVFEGKKTKVTLKTRNLIEHFNLYFQLLFAIDFSIKEKSHWYVYMPHKYWSIAFFDEKTAIATKWRKSIDSLSCFIVVNQNTFLDHWIQDQLESLDNSTESKTIFLSEPTDVLPNNVMIETIQDFILTWDISDEVIETFEPFFEKVKKAKDFDQKAFRDLFEKDMECKISLRRSPRDATKFQNKIKKLYWDNN